MEINQTKVVPVNAKTLRIHVKCADRFTAHILDDAGCELGGQDDGYVPSFMPGTHYGDYIMLDIDLDTGVITNWNAPSAEQVQEFIAGDDDDR